MNMISLCSNFGKLVCTHDNNTNWYVWMCIRNRKEIPVIVNVRCGYKVQAASGDGGGIMVAGEKKAE